MNSLNNKAVQLVMLDTGAAIYIVIGNLHNLIIYYAGYASPGTASVGMHAAHLVHKNQCAELWTVMQYEGPRAYPISPRAYSVRGNTDKYNICMCSLSFAFGRSMREHQHVLTV